MPPFDPHFNPQYNLCNLKSGKSFKGHTQRITFTEGSIELKPSLVVANSYYSNYILDELCFKPTNANRFTKEISIYGNAPKYIVEPIRDIVAKCNAKYKFTPNLYINNAMFQMDTIEMLNTGETITFSIVCQAPTFYPIGGGPGYGSNGNELYFKFEIKSPHTTFTDHYTNIKLIKVGKRAINAFKSIFKSENIIDMLEESECSLDKDVSTIRFNLINLLDLHDIGVKDFMLVDTLEPINFYRKLG